MCGGLCRALSIYRLWAALQVTHAWGSLGVSDSPEWATLWLSDLCYPSWHRFLLVIGLASNRKPLYFPEMRDPKKVDLGALRILVLGFLEWPAWEATPVGFIL